jgi:hypothetical protein
MRVRMDILKRCHKNLTLPLSKPLLNLPLTGTTYETFSLQERETTKWWERLK